MLAVSREATPGSNHPIVDIRVTKRSAGQSVAPREVLIDGEHRATFMPMLGSRRLKLHLLDGQAAHCIKDGSSWPVYYATGSLEASDLAEMVMPSEVLIRAYQVSRREDEAGRGYHQVGGTVDATIDEITGWWNLSAPADLRVAHFFSIHCLRPIYAGHRYLHWIPAADDFSSPISPEKMGPLTPSQCQLEGFDGVRFTFYRYPEIIVPPKSSTDYTTFRADRVAGESGIRFGERSSETASWHLRLECYAELFNAKRKFPEQFKSIHMKAMRRYMAFLAEQRSSPAQIEEMVNDADQGQ